MWFFLACAVQSAGSETTAAAEAGPPTGCPAFTGFDRVGRGAELVNVDAPAWSRRVTVAGLAEDTTFTVTETTTNDGSTGAPASSETDVVTLTCDADGLFVLGWDSTLSDAGGTHRSTLLLDAPYKLLPATMEAGTTWTQQRSGVFVASEGEGRDVAWAGPVDTFTVEEKRPVETPAGTFPAWRVAVSRDFGTGTPDAVQTDGYAYADDAGLVAVEGGGTEIAAVLKSWW